MTVGALVAICVAGGVVTAAATTGDGAEPAVAASSATKTTTIRRQDLVETEEVDGTLGYADPRAVVNRLSGTLTWAPEAGTVVRTNHRLYEVDGTAVYLLDGTYPAYRTLQPGLKGDDVRQLERNLRELDLDPDGDMQVDGVWDDGTTAAAKRWQQRKGLDQDGTIEAERIVFAPGARRVGEVAVEVGATAGGADAAGAAQASALLTTTSTRRLVSVDLEATKQSLAERGDAVTLELPDGDEVGGTVTSVGRVAERAASANDEDPPATIEVQIALERARPSLLDQAPVDVRFEKQRAENVLTVPVTALLALQGGEFAVEVREGAQRRVVAVETGLYTDNFVEIDGDGLAAGMTVTNAGV
jgi:peptidoglycan hydrolase-like protein with peptidoglycan-binding domain